MMKPFFILVFSLFLLSVFAQQDSILLNKEAQLKIYLEKLRNASNDSEKENANQIFRDYLVNTIKIKGAFEYPFSSLKTLGTVKSPDNVFRLFNWNVELDDHSNKYYCYILKLDEKKNEYNVIELKDNSMMLPTQPDDILTEDNWYGALYYKIIPIEKSKKKFYTVLGWDGNSMVSNIKIIDVLSFNGSHVKIGSPIFKMNDGLKKRVFFEYSKRAFMSLNFDQTRGRIIFDHLSPETPSLEGFREYYVPDLSYDELKYYNNKWHFKEDVIGVNSSNKQAVQKVAYAKSKKDGSLVVDQKDEKNKWVDPSDENAPSGKNLHVAHLPENEKVAVNKPEKEAKTTTKGKQKYKKSEFSMNPFLNGRKK